MKTRPVPQAAIDLTKKRETLVLFAYDDAHFPPRPAKPGDKIDGTLTIAWGHTKGVKIGDTCTLAQANLFIALDFEDAAEELADCVSQTIINSLSENQYAALLVFVLNCGAQADWSIWDVVAAKQFPHVPAKMIEFIHTHVNGALVTSAGLVTRRAYEIVLWDTA